MESSDQSNSYLAGFAAGAYPLEKIVITDQLSKRPARSPNYQKESQALRDLSKLLSVSPQNAMKGLVEQAKLLCGADSAGISIAETENGNRIFRWHAISGTLEPFLNGTMPRDFSPCGVVCDVNAAVLMHQMVDHYKYVEGLGLNLFEVLLVPFFQDGVSIGTVWIVSHGDHKMFDSEDLRILSSLAEFTAGIVQSYFRSQELERTNTKLQTEKVAREQLIESLSHDLRTPLTTARIGAQVIARSPEPFLAKQAKRIVASMDRADAMIRDLLDLSLIKAGEKVRLNFENLDLGDVVRITTEEMAAIHGNRFDVSASGVVIGNWDKEAIRRVLENLLTNAIKYGDAKRPIIVLMKELNAETAMFSVQNFGTPISQNDSEKLFGQYQRSEEALAGSQQGWGIGLMIVRGLVESMSGKVSLVSNETDGTTFTVLLPLKI